MRAFQEHVSLKYQLYNGLFLALPFSSLKETGIKLPLFSELCSKEIEKGTSPEKIVDSFFKEILQVKEFESKMSILFLFLQLIERQVVLFDALEDAAFTKTHDVQGHGSLDDFIEQFNSLKFSQDQIKFFKNYRTRLVLTAHPTQFYPTPVLHIIQELTKAISKNNLLKIESLLLQMGKTPFKNQKAPTPISEALSLIERFKDTFFSSLVQIQDKLNRTLHNEREKIFLPAIEIGFWPGGDRDGNPFVTAKTTLEVARKLKKMGIKKYLDEIRKAKRSLTFKGVDKIVNKIENRLKGAFKSFHTGYENENEFVRDLKKLHRLLKEEHQSLFIEQVDKLLLTVQIFGFHFASIDLRQDSRVHSETIHQLLGLLSEIDNYLSKDPLKKFEILENYLTKEAVNIVSLEEKLEPLFLDTLQSLRAAFHIQKTNGEKGANRYIISRSKEAYHILEVLLLAHWGEPSLPKIPLDLIPLFESIEDIRAAPHVMEKLYKSKTYRNHLEGRGKVQIVMLGFSDGTKDGGYCTCNWEIFKCKQALLRQAKKEKIELILFDGRGGPSSRGGGNTHQFYKALSYQFPQKQIQLTIQGQTISSNFGTKDTAKFNIEQLFTSGLDVFINPHFKGKLTKKEKELLEELSLESYKAYSELKNHPDFLPFLETMTPLEFLSKLNIASRPTKRVSKESLSLEDLRAISFVSTWAEMKLNVPGFYGLGFALSSLIEKGKKNKLKFLYRKSLLFRTLIDNTMQSLLKSSPKLTNYLLDEPQFKSLIKLLHDEAELTKTSILAITGDEKLLTRDPLSLASINLREELILPLTVILHYALIKLKKAREESKKASLNKLILKSIPALINASRNSA